MVDEQPHVEFGAGELGDRQAIEPFAQRGAGDGDRVDAVGFAAVAAAAALAGHQPRRDANDPLPADQQESLKRAGDVPAVLQRPMP